LSLPELRNEPAVIARPKPIASHFQIDGREGPAVLAASEEAVGRFVLRRAALDPLRGLAVLKALLAVVALHPAEPYTAAEVAHRPGGAMPILEVDPRVVADDLGLAHAIETR
jgi:hypothetical protein